MNKNEEYTVTCTGMTDQGFGVAHIEGMTVFIADLLPEEEAKIKIIKVFKKYAVGKVVERLHTSNHRIEPKCPVTKQCGGCAFQHMEYSEQLKRKQQELQHLFHSVNPQIEVLPPIGMEEPFYYRNKAQFPLAVKEGKVISGFYKPKSNEIVDIPQCSIQSEEINAIYKWIKEHLTIEVAKELRHIFIRTSLKTGQAQVVFIGSSDHGLQKLSDEMVKQFPKLSSVIFNRNQSEGNTILGEDYTVLYGSEYILEECLGLNVILHFKSFFQVNPRQMEVLYRKALQMADIKPEDTVIELYSGTGTIGMLASRKARKVIGVEIVRDAVENAKENVKLNGIENAQFICQDATLFARENKEKADIVIVDPPRKGMTSQGIHDITVLNPRTIVYISCNPRTLARDLKDFQDRGYICKEIQPVDMFPQTAHIECIACLKKDGQ